MIIVYYLQYWMLINYTHIRNRKKKVEKQYILNNLSTKIAFSIQKMSTHKIIFPHQKTKFQRLGFSYF